MDITVIRKKAKTLFYLCFLVYTTSYITRLNLSTSMNDMINAGCFDKEFGGAVATGFLVCYGIGQLLNGFLGDRISPRVMLSVGIIMSGVMNILMGLFTSAGMLMTVWCLNGFFCSMLWAPVVRCFSEFMPKDVRSRAGVMISVTIPLGGVLAYLTGSIMLKVADYRALFVLSGCIGIAAGIIWLAGTGRLSSYFTEVRTLTIAERTAMSKKNGTSVSFLKLIFTTGLIFAVFCILFNGVLKDGITVWIPTFLSERFEVSSSFAALISLILPIVNLLGAFAANYLNNRFFKNEYKTVATMFSVSALSVLLLYLAGSVSPVLSALLIALCTSSMLGANTMLLTFIPLRYSALGCSSSVTGFLDACSYLASAVASVSFGVISSSGGWDLTIASWGAVAILGLAFAVIGSKKNRFSAH